MAVAVKMHTGKRAPGGPQHTGCSLVSSKVGANGSNGHSGSNGHAYSGSNGHSNGTDASRCAAVRRLLRAYHQQDDLRARESLIQQYLPLVRRLARRHAGRGEQFEDLVQVGTIGLIKAIDRFELERGMDLASFAIPTIDGEIKRHLRDRASPIRIPRRLQELDPSLKVRVIELVDGQNGELEQGSVVERGYELGEDRATLAQGFRVLDERERRLLRLAFFDGLSQSQIAREVGISQIHVSRLMRRALAKLRAEIE
jgi:RNA polymerase sigma-B factor